MSGRSSSSVDLPDPARAVARATLYEGYVLWPYRKSALKNQRRWTFGGVLPRDWSDAGHPDDLWRMRTECLVAAPEEAEGAAGGSVHAAAGSVYAAVRFLQVVERRVARAGDDGLVFVDEIEVAGGRVAAWDEARERDVELPPLPLVDGAVVRARVSVPAASEREWLTDEAGERHGAVVRTWRTLCGDLEARCERVDGGAFRVAIEVSNTTPWRGEGREDALRSCFASTHFVLRASGASFVSLTDPPPALEEVAAACRNEGCWPVLVGPRGSREHVLASRIILPDHPVVAPESPVDMFDAGEMDEMLALHVLALTDEEKEEMRATDPRTREILERMTSLGEERMLGLHGAYRDAATGDPVPHDRTPGLAEGAPDPFWVEMGRAPASRVTMDGVLLERGSRVVLHPAPGGDVMDIVLDGRVGIIEGIDEDDLGGLQFTVVVEGDPGLDMGMARMPGHRFFFRPEEIEPLRPTRILVAGIGNIFLGDDGFGVQVARRLCDRRLPPNVTVEDFGIRGLDLAYALAGYDVAIFVDAVPRGGEPGTLYVIDASDEELAPAGLQTHGMDPVSVLAFAGEVGSVPDGIYVVGCEPKSVPDPDDPTIVEGLSDVVEAAVEEAAGQVEALIDRLLGARAPGGGPQPAPLPAPDAPASD